MEDEPDKLNFFIKPLQDYYDFVENKIIAEGGYSIVLVFFWWSSCSDFF
jgi:hypothetical protein